MTDVSSSMQMTKYEEDEDGVMVHFDRGQPSVRAKVLIGADGYFSGVRKQCLNDGPPMFAVSASPPLCTPHTLPAPLLSLQRRAKTEALLLPATPSMNKC